MSTRLAMPDSEIAARYRQAKEPQKQIRILAELCNTSRTAILDALNREGIETGMAVTDYMEQIVSRFNVEVYAGLALIRECRNILPYLLDSFDKEDKFGFTTLTLCVGNPSRAGGRGSVPGVNPFLELVRRKYWGACSATSAGEIYWNNGAAGTV